MRPQSGINTVQDLLTSWLLAYNIQYGLELRNNPVIEYLYYLGQVGIASSPTETHYMRVPYSDQYFMSFFRHGHPVSISTGHPTQFCYTGDCLLEEYVTVAKLWKLNNVDLSEVARNSVLMSSFTHEVPP